MAWEIDNSHSGVLFTVRHMVFAKVHGAFGKWTATLDLDEADFTRSKVSASIDAASIDTNEEKRDGHLRSADFFDAEKHPRLTFAGKGIRKVDGDRYQLSGDLTIRGTTKPVTFDVEYGGRGKDPWGMERVAFTAKGKIDRKDFGLTWNQVLEAGGVLVGETIDIAIEVEAVKK